MTPSPGAGTYAADTPPQDARTDVHGWSPVPPAAGPVPAAPARRSISVRASAAIAAGALVVGIALGSLTGALLGPGGPGGPGGQPPGATTSQDGTGTQGAAPGGTATDGSGTATQGTSGT